MRAKIGSIEIAFDDAGGGETIVLLHGHPFDRRMWRGQIEFLRKNHRVVCPDLRGYGETPRVGNVSKMSEMAGDVASLLDHLRLERIALGGLSMGGYVALEFYNLFPARVSALILADTKAGADAEDARMKRYEIADKVEKEGMKAIADDMLPKVFAPVTPVSQPEIVENTKQMMLAANPAGAAAGLRGMAERSDHFDLLAKIAVPTLIIVGEDDKITTRAEAEKMHRAIAGSAFVRITDAGHLSAVEQTDEFNDALMSFLDRIIF